MFELSMLYSIGPGDGLAPNRQQAITSGKESLVCWLIYASIGLSELSLQRSRTIARIPGDQTTDKELRGKKRMYWSLSATNGKTTRPIYFETEDTSIQLFVSCGYIFSYWCVPMN